MKPYYEDPLVTIYNADCRDLVDALSGFDAVVTDPPYGIPHHDASWCQRKHSRLDGKAAAYRTDYGNVKLPAPDIEAIRHLALFAKAIVWGGNFFGLPAASKWLVWDKKNDGKDFADCELAWTNLTGATRMFRWRWDGMLQEDMGNKEIRVHPTQKPLALMKWCIAQFNQVSCVLDPYAGSGTTLRAAKDQGVKSIGIEIDERYCELAAKRMSQGSLSAMFQ